MSWMVLSILVKGNLSRRKGHTKVVHKQTQVCILHREACILLVGYHGFMFDLCSTCSNHFVPEYMSMPYNHIFGNPGDVQVLKRV